VSVPARPEDLDAAWLEAVLRARAFPSARVRAVSHELIGVGFGLAGTSARLTLAGDDVPRTLVGKWAKTKDVRAEARFYDVVAPRLESGRGFPLQLARLFAHASADDAERGVLVFEDLAPCRQGDVLVGATPREAGALIDAMAVLHAAFWDAADDAETASLPKWGDDAEKRVRNVAEALPRFLAEWRGRVPDAAFAFAADLPKRVEDAHGGLAQAPQTLVHGDLHLDNVLFRPDGTPVVLDWPSVMRGPAARDFGHFLVEGLSADGRRAGGRPLAGRYAAALAARGVTGYDEDALRRDAERVVVVLFGAAVRWNAGPNAPKPDVPRVPLVAESLLRNTAAAVVEGLA
jgi:hypothetical protein